MYTSLGRIVAFLAIVFGLLRIATAAFVLFGADADPAAIARYLGSVDSIGEAMDQGLFTVLFGIALGVVVEISRSLKTIAGITAVYEEDDI